MSELCQKHEKSACTAHIRHVILQALKLYYYNSLNKLDVYQDLVYKFGYAIE
jgi:hypothetical protein